MDSSSSLSAPSSSSRPPSVPATPSLKDGKLQKPWTVTKTIQLAENRFLVVSVTYPKGARFSEEKAERDLDQVCSRMVQLANVMELGQGKLQKFRITDGIIYGEYVNSKGKTVSKDLKAKLMEKWQSMDPQSPDRQIMEARIRMIDKTVGKFAKMFPPKELEPPLETIPAYPVSPP